MADQIEFLKAILPDAGVYFVGEIANKKYKQKSCDSFEEVVTAIQQAKSRHRDVYVATGTYKDGSKREAKNAQYKKCFVLDLDVDPDDNKKFDTKKHALSELTKFLRDSRFLAPTFITDSGTGLHVWWALDKPLAASKWGRYGKALKEMTTQYAFNADPAVTADVARIMRVPGTLNYKHKTPSPCRVVKAYGQNLYSIEQVETALSEFLSQHNNVISLFKGLDNSELETGANFRPRHFKHAMEECPALKHIYETGGADSSEEEWKTVLNLLLFCEDGEAYIHPVSNRHPDYSAQDTKIKWSQRQEAQERQGFGAPSCDSFHACDPARCEACPHWESPERGVQWVSPIHFGIPHDERALPYPYVLVDDGIAKRETDPDTDETTITKIIPYRFDTIRVFHKTGVATLAMADFELSGKSTEVTMDSENFYDPRALGKMLSRYGVHMHQKEISELATLMTAFTRQMQAAKKTSPLSEQFGWVIKQGHCGFAVGEYVYWDDGRAQRTVVPDVEYAQHFLPRGTKEGWQQTARWALEANHIETEVLIASAFASPLVKFTTVPGVLMSAVSRKSGTGKTTALKIAQAVWGSPRKLMHSLDDTPNAIAKRIGISNSLPALWDEVRIYDKEARRMVNFIYQLSQGREKARMQATTKLQTSYSWETMMVCCSNGGLREHINDIDKHTEAGMLRVFEFQVSALDEVRMHDPTAFTELENNYGHVGVEYARYLAENKKSVEAATQELVRRLMKDWRCSSDERFIVATAATIILGAQLANRLGFLSFNVKGVTQFMKEQLLSIRKELRATGGNNESIRDPRGIINSFLEDHNQEVLVTDILQAGRGAGAQHPVAANEDKLRSNSPVAQIATDDGVVRIRKDCLIKFAYQTTGGSKWVEEWFESNDIKPSRRRVGYGIVPGFGDNARQCYDIPLELLNN